MVHVLAQSDGLGQRAPHTIAPEDVQVGGNVPHSKSVASVSMVGEVRIAA